jgi:hypothetical protein
VDVLKKTVLRPLTACVTWTVDPFLLLGSSFERSAMFTRLACVRVKAAIPSVRFRRPVATVRHEETFVEGLLCQSVVQLRR